MLPVIVNTNGVFSQDLNAFSDDNTVLLHIPAGAVGLIDSEALLTQLSHDTYGGATRLSSRGLA